MASSTGNFRQAPMMRSMPAYTVPVQGGLRTDQSAHDQLVRTMAPGSSRALPASSAPATTAATAATPPEVTHQQLQMRLQLLQQQQMQRNRRYQEQQQRSGGGIPPPEGTPASALLAAGPAGGTAVQQQQRQQQQTSIQSSPPLMGHSPYGFGRPNTPPRAGTPPASPMQHARDIQLRMVSPVRSGGYASIPEGPTFHVPPAPSSLASASSIRAEEDKSLAANMELIRQRIKGQVLPALSAVSAASAGTAHQRPSGLPPFYWVPTPETILEFEVSGSSGELVTKTGDYGDRGSALPIAGTLRMDKGALYVWTLQVVRHSNFLKERPPIHFGIHGVGHARPWRLVNSSRCSRSRDDGPWMSRPAGDVTIVEGDYIHCEVDLRGLSGPLGTFSFALNSGEMETVFEDIPLSDGTLQPVLAMGGDGTIVRVCST